MRAANLRRVLVALVLVIGVGVVAAACGGGGDDSTLTLVAYTTPREVYAEVIPSFQATPAGQGIGFEQSYGPSGDQSRAVEGGLAADVLALSLAPDVTRLEELGIVDPAWDDGPSQGFVSTSIVVFAVREGNPKNVRTWDDLLRDDIEVITPNPFSSGGAQWNIAAAYGSRRAQGESHEEAVQYLAGLFARVPVQPKGARESLQVFNSGKGDVLLAYENEAIFAKQQGEPIDFVVPDETVLIQNPIASTNSSNPEAARAFVDYALDEEAQQVFADKGYRAVNEQVAAANATTYPDPPGLFTVDEALGGWAQFRADFFDPNTGIMADIYAGRGFDVED
jgi:sulfate/thiosulfate transport system substrate-binding protein